MAKSTSTVNLATYLAAARRKVIALDLDPQGDLTVAFGINADQLKKPAYRLLIEDEIAVPDILIYQPERKVALDLPLLP